MRFVSLCASVVALTMPAALLAAPAHADSSRLTADDLRTDALTTPLGIGDTTPALSWRQSGTGRNEAQTAYQIEAASSRTRLDHPDLWNSGKVTSGSPRSEVTTPARIPGHQNPCAAGVRTTARRTRLHPAEEFTCPDPIHPTRRRHRRPAWHGHAS